MKVKEIELGRKYAVRLVMPAAAGVAKCTPIVFATAMDIAGNTIVLEQPVMVLTDKGRKLRAGNPDMLVGNQHYEPGTTLIRVAATNVICFAEEWQYDQPDGREEAPRITYDAGHRVVEQRLPVFA
jgi:hypothetical protein